MSIIKKIFSRKIGIITIIKSVYVFFRTRIYKYNKNIFNTFIHGKTKLYFGKNIEIVNKGELKIGISKTGTTFISKDIPILHLSNNSKLIINGKFSAGPGTTISLGENAKLILGDNTSITANSKMICHKNIRIGNNVAISWEVQIMDTDFHYIDKKYPNKKSIIIGDNVWVGSRVTIMKGVKIGSGAVVAAGSVVTKSVPRNVLVAGVPAEIIKEDIEWKYN